MKRHKDPDVAALAKAAEALKGSTSRRALLANMEFLWSYFVDSPSSEVPEHLRSFGPTLDPSEPSEKPE